jgi:hypothetical protein
MEEEKPVEPSFLEQVKVERASMEKVRDENKAILERLEQLKAEEILAGKTDAGQKQEEKKEETPKEYADRMLKGK